jgi:hypothetical protein
MLEGRVDTYISKLDLSNLAQSTNNFPADFIRNVELGQGHFRRPEKGVLGDRHGCGHDLVWPHRARVGMPKVSSRTGVSGSDRSARSNSGRVLL